MKAVRKLKITIENENSEVKESEYQFIRDEIYNQYRGLNLAMGILGSNFQISKLSSGEECRLQGILTKKEEGLDKLKKEDVKLKEKITKKEESLNKIKEKPNQKDFEVKLKKNQDALGKLKEDFRESKKNISQFELDIQKTKKDLECSKDYRSNLIEQFEEKYARDIYQVLKAIPFQYEDHKSTISEKVRKDFKSDLKNGLARGERSVRNYKKNTFLMTKGSTLKFYKKEGKYFIGWINGIVFKIVLGRKDKDYRELVSTLNRILEEQYRVCQSAIGFDENNQLMLNLTLELPESKLEGRSFIEGRVLGIDLGLAIPAYGSLNDVHDIRRAFGNAKEFTNVRMQMKARRKRLQAQLVLAKGGRGRKDKLKNMEQFREKERNFAHTYNHMISKRIVEFATKNKCQFIHLEKLTKEGFKEKILGVWSYYELLSMIEYKAIKEGIVVKYINPAYTSQKCSLCGKIDKENRKDQSHFLCVACGYKENADYNASRNIAMSKEFVDNDLT